MKRFWALLIVGVTAAYAPCAYSDDAPAAAVVERTDCADVKAQIDKLSSAADLSEESTATLESLQSEYRRNCMARVSGRIRSAGRPGVRSAHPVVADATGADDNTPDASDDAVAADTAAATDTTDDAVATDNNTDAATEKVLTEEEAIALIEAGLCLDGEKPNKYGCCGDEKFTDMGNLVFACCPPDGGDCFPPMNTEQQ